MVQVFPFAALLIGVLFVSIHLDCCCYAAAPKPVRPDTVSFAFLQNMQDAILAVDGNDLFAGMKAAELEINSGNVLRGMNLSIDFVGAPSLATDASTAVGTIIATTIATGKYFGFVLPDFVSSAYALAAIDAVSASSAFSVVAPRSLTVTTYTDKYKHVINHREPLTSEYLMMLNHAFNNDDVHCSRFIVFTRPFLPTTIASDIATFLVDRGFAAPLAMDLGADYISPINLTTVLNFWWGNGTAVPLCALFFAIQTDITQILEGLYTDARFDSRSVHSYGCNLATAPLWNSTRFGVAPFQNLHFVSNFPDPTNRTIAISQQYQDALSTWLASAPVVPSAFNVSLVRTTPNYVSFEGYLAARMIGEMLKDLVDVTPSDFIKDIYSQRYFYVGDSTFGPFLNRCVQFTNLPCFCNTGPSDLYIISVNATTGVPQFQPMASHHQVASLVYHNTDADCYASSSSMKIPVVVGTFLPINVDATTMGMFAMYIEFMSRMLDVARDASANVFYSTGWVSKTLPMKAGESSDAYFVRVYETNRPFAVIGSYFATVPRKIPNFFISPTLTLDDAPLTTATELSRYTLQARPTFGEMIHTAAVYLSRRLDSSQMDIRLYSDAAPTFDRSLQSLNTFQLIPNPDRSGVVNLTRQDVTSDMITRALRDMTPSLPVVLMVIISSSSTSVATFLLTLATVVASSSLPAASYRNLIVVVATEETSLMQAKIAILTQPNTASLVAALSQVEILFPTFLMPFWEPMNQYRNAMVSMLNTTNLVPIEFPGFYIAAILSDVVTTTTARLKKSSITPQDFLDEMYRVKIGTAQGLTMGPVYDANCTVGEVSTNTKDRICQCSKMWRTINVYDYRDWLLNSNTHTQSFHWAMPTCGVVYQPLIVATSLNVRLIVAIVVPCGTVLVVLLAYLICFHGKRNNRTAPNEPNVPFAMVFTDIQSSTSLWARAPEIMGPALEQHHELIRQLIRRHSGYEVKTIGDSFMVAFKHAADATSFSLAVQTTLFDADWALEIDEVYRQLAQEVFEETQMHEAKAADYNSNSGGLIPQWADDTTYFLNWHGIRVRVGMHFGIGSVKFDQVSQGYDYYGTLVNTAARVEGVGNGGQVLLTKDMYDELERCKFSFDSIDLNPLGPQPLRGLDAPVPLYQISPARLKGRQYNALRLDVEIDLEDESSETTAGTNHLESNSTGDQHTAATAETAEQHLEKLLRRSKISGKALSAEKTAELNEAATHILTFLDTMFRPTAATWKKETIKTLMKKWHVPQRQTREKESSSVATAQFDLTSLAVKVLFAAEESRKAGCLGKDTVSSADNSRSEAPSEGGGAPNRKSLRRQSSFAKEFRRFSKEVSTSEEAK